MESPVAADPANAEPNVAAKPTEMPLFMAAGNWGLRTYSADGKNWSAPEVGKEGEVFRAAAFGNGRFVAVGNYGGSNIFATYQPATGWKTAAKDAQYANFLRGLGFGKKMFLGLGGDPGAVGGSRPFVMTSSDGESWSDVKSIAGKNIIRRVACGNEIFVAVGDRGRRAMSKDGFEWIDTPDVKATDTLIDIAFGNGLFVGVGLHGLRMWSEDGLKWSPRIDGEEGEHLNTIVWAKDRFVAVSQRATLSSPNGVDWKRASNSLAPVTMCYGNGMFVGTKWKGQILSSADAREWTLVHKVEHHVEALACSAAPVA